MSTDVRFFGGVDWASETHQVCLVAADGKIIGERAFAHGGAGLAEMCDWLVTTSGEEPPTVAVAIEVPHGPVVEILLERRFQVDAVNPKQLDRFRDQFTVAGRRGSLILLRVEFDKSVRGKFVELMGSVSLDPAKVGHAKPRRLASHEGAVIETRLVS